MKIYGICIGDWICEGNFMLCKAANKTEARKQGALYKRQWEVREPILAIVEIPESIWDTEARREYAVIEARKQHPEAA